MRRFAIAFLLSVLAWSPVCAQNDPTCRPLLRPIAATHIQPSYPHLAQQMKENGTTILRLVVGADGVPIDVTVYKSSGALRLDRAAIAHVKASWRWQPFSGLDCHPASVATLLAMVWRLQDAPYTGLHYTELFMAQSDYPAVAIERKEQGFVSLVVTAPADGSSPQIVVENTSGFPDLDAKALQIIKTRYRWKPDETSGKTVTAMRRLLVVWTLPLPSEK